MENNDSPQQSPESIPPTEAKPIKEQEKESTQVNNPPPSILKEIDSSTLKTPFTSIEEIIQTQTRPSDSLPIQTSERTFTASKKILSSSWNITKKSATGIVWFGRQIPKFFQGMTSFGIFFQKHKKTLKKVILVSILIIFCGFGYFAYQKNLQWQFIHKMRGIIVEAEGWFIQGNYQKAIYLYEQVLTQIQEPNTLAFLQIRKRMTLSLCELQEAIKQDQLNSIDEILQRGKKEEWDNGMNAIFLAHCNHFQHSINKLRQYQKNVQEILELLKQGKQNDAEALLLKNIEIAKSSQKSLLPLRNEMLRGVQEGYPVMLLIAWKYQTALQLDKNDFSQALGENYEEQRKKVSKMLEIPNIEIGEILAKLLRPEDCKILGNSFLPNESTPDEMKEIHLQLALIFDPWLERGYLQQAEYFRKQKKYNEAQESYQKANISYHANILNSAAWCFVEQRNWPQAIATWKKILEICPNYEDAHLGMALIYGICQNWKEVEKQLNSIPNKIASSYSERFKSWRQGKNLDISAESIISDNPIFYAYLLINLAIAQSTENTQYHRLLQQAESLLNSQNIQSYEVWLHQILINNDQEMLKRLEESQEPLAKICHALYSKNKQPNQQIEFQNLPESWQNFWQEIK